MLDKSLQEMFNCFPSNKKIWKFWNEKGENKILSLEALIDSKKINLLQVASKSSEMVIY